MNKIEQNENIDSNKLLDKLHGLMRDLQSHKQRAITEARKINELITETQIKLSQVQEDKVNAMIKDLNVEKLEIEENKLLNQLSLLKTKKENIFNGNNEIIVKKMLDLVPDLIVSKNQEHEFKKHQQSEIEGIDKKIESLKKKRMEVSLKDHPYRQCSFLIDDLERLTHIPKNTIYRAMCHVEGKDKVNNPYFGGEE